MKVKIMFKIRTLEAHNTQLRLLSRWGKVFTYKSGDFEVAIPPEVSLASTALTRRS
jgi:hypothetical protein